jgi:hypothetical protein
LPAAAEPRILPEAFFMRIAAIAMISGVLCGWSLQASAYADVAASPDSASGAAEAPATASPTSGSTPAPAEHTAAAAAAAATKSAASDEASAAQTAEEKAKQEKADLVLFRRLGFYQRTVKGETRFCRTEHVSGSRLESTTTCHSAEQIKAMLQAQK